MTSLYRFFSCSEFSKGTSLNRDIDALASSYLWFSRVCDFNDPFEGLYIEQLEFRRPEDIADSELEVLLLAASKRKGGAVQKLKPEHDISKLQPVEVFQQKVKVSRSIESSLTETLSDIKIKSCICCFNKDWKSNKVLENKLMWSHYANGLRGMAIEFDGEALDLSLEELNNEDIQGGEVDYSGLTGVDAIELMVEYASLREGGISKVLLKKCSEWKYEQEHRLVALSNKLFYSPSSIRSITVGQRMECISRGELLRVLKELGLIEKLQVAVIDKKTFNINIQRYHSSLFN